MEVYHGKQMINTANVLLAQVEGSCIGFYGGTTHHLTFGTPEKAMEAFNRMKAAAVSGKNAVDIDGEPVDSIKSLSDDSFLEDINAE